jgi:hypothetical protein
LTVNSRTSTTNRSGMVRVAAEIAGGLPAAELGR